MSEKDNKDKKLNSQESKRLAEARKDYQEIKKRIAPFIKKKKIPIDTTSTKWRESTNIYLRHKNKAIRERTGGTTWVKTI